MNQQALQYRYTRRVELFKTLAGTELMLFYRVSLSGSTVVVEAQIALLENSWHLKTE